MENFKDFKSIIENNHSRIETLFDAVIAIAMTMTALEISVSGFETLICRHYSCYWKRLQCTLSVSLHSLVFGELIQFYTHHSRHSEVWGIS
ncbi:DUF1211 domain-containing protein (plasmid) [Enterococcus casseliflavus]|nr:DUF1211 domain-containing protein [Enterococcus casseliflavus]